MTQKGFYILINTKKSEVITLSDDYEILIKFMMNHEYICRNSVVKQIKRREFEEALAQYNDLYLCEFDNIPIRQKDLSTFMGLKSEENCNLMNTIMGLNRVAEWGSLKKKEIEAINTTIKVLFKYLDDDQKMLKKSGIKSMCSDIKYLDELQRLQYRD